MGDLIFGLALIGFACYQEHSLFMGTGGGYYYIFDVVGALLVLLGIFKMIRGKNMDDR